MREALRLNDRYVTELVLAFGLCPWAEGVLRAGALARRVLLGPNPSVTECLAIIDGWSAPRVDGATPAVAVEVGFVILPLRAGGRGAFDSFAESVRRADRARRPLGAPAPFMIAAFHPEGSSAFSSPHQLVSFLRRSPDPLLQVVRAELLDRVTATAGDVSAAIAARNFATLGEGAAKARFDERVRDIREDRDRTYAGLGVA